MLKIWLFYGLVVYVFIPLFAITQIVIPTIMGRALFPIFRSKRRKFEQELAELHSGMDDSLLEEEVRREREKAQKVKDAASGTCVCGTCRKPKTKPKKGDS